MPHNYGDWLAWHTAYDNAAADARAARLRLVQQTLVEALLERPAGPLTLAAWCSGQAHDVIGALADNPRAADVHAHFYAGASSDLERARAAVMPSFGARVSFHAGRDVPTLSEPADILCTGDLFDRAAPTDYDAVVRDIANACRPGAAVVWSVCAEHAGFVKDFFWAAGCPVVAEREASGVVAGIATVARSGWADARRDIPRLDAGRLKLVSP